MNARIRAHLRSNIVGYIALFCFAFGSTAQALPGTNKVDSGDIKNFQVKKKDLAKNAVSGENVIDGSLGAADISSAALKEIFAGGVVSSVKLADGTVLTSNLADGSVTTPKLADNSIDSDKVVDDSLTAADLKGADVNGGGISVPAGYVPNGRCRQLDANVGGAGAGQAVLFSVQAALQDGVMIYGQRVPSEGHVMFDVCNFSGTTQAAINDLPVRIITFE